MAERKAGCAVAAYVRCSTAEQNDALQRRAIAAWAKANGAEVRWYADKASGTNGERPGWQRPGFWSKLTDKQRAEIRRLHEAGVSKAALARQFKVTWPTVHKVIGEAA